MLAVGGESEPPDFVRALVQRHDVVIAADAGLEQVLAAGLDCHLLVGDLDSYPEAASLPRERVRQVWVHPTDKDHSDLELALQCALATQPSEVVFFGALGGRLDHLLLNLGQLHACIDQGVPASVQSSRGSVYLLAADVPGLAYCELAASPDMLFSLIAATPWVRGITLEGARYELDGASLAWSSSRGLSNIAEAPHLRCNIKEGRLLLVTHQAWNQA